MTQRVERYRGQRVKQQPVILSTLKKKIKFAGNKLQDHREAVQPTNLGNGIVTHPDDDMRHLLGEATGGAGPSNSLLSASGESAAPRSNSSTDGRSGKLETPV